MRVRPFFWALLAFVCASVLVFAVLVTNNRAYPLQAQIEQVLTSPVGVTVVRLHLTDTEDKPVDQATILLSASMPTMSMEPPVANLQALGQGGYLARFHLSMTGLWQLVFQVSAPGFLPAHQLLTLQVSSAYVKKDEGLCLNQLPMTLPAGPYTLTIRRSCGTNANGGAIADRLSRCRVGSQHIRS